MKPCLDTVCEVISCALAMQLSTCYSLLNCQRTWTNGDFGLVAVAKNLYRWCLGLPPHTFYHLVVIVSSFESSRFEPSWPGTPTFYHVVVVVSSLIGELVGTVRSLPNCYLVADHNHILSRGCCRVNN